MFEGLFRGEHLLIILAIVVLVFPNKLAGLGGSLGKTIRDFKKAMQEPEQPSASAAPGALPEKTDAEARTAPPPVGGEARG
jgi:sec-independent protein translocase protein TatA